MAEDDKKADEEKDAATTENDDADDADESENDEGAEGEASASEDDAADAPAVVEPPRKRRTRNVQEVGAPPPPAGVGKSVFVFIGIFAVLAGGFFVLGNSEPFGGAGNKPKWAVGQKVAIDLTLDPKDDVKLGCASNVEVKGRRCEFEDKTKKFAGKLEDATQLRPYTTTDGTQLLAAGVWSQPELAPAKRPADRFTVRCQYTVEGMIKNPAIQWDRGPNWLDQQRDWHAGIVSDCKLQN
ncbi:MAG TPA: hypothetical protein VL400_25045 [Polyangiaceae bacterium]|jgi:hypothetical protein|nr:hypothetical protein [Polyangiaceae bacterium]